MRDPDKFVFEALDISPAALPNQFSSTSLRNRVRTTFYFLYNSDDPTAYVDYLKYLLQRAISIVREPYFLIRRNDFIVGKPPVLVHFSDFFSGRVRSHVSV